MKTLEKEKAVELRRQGKTFNEILKEVTVSKGSLSYWLKDISLTVEQLSRIQYKNDKIKEKFIEFNELKRQRANENKQLIVNNAVRDIQNISARELKLVGIALYWAEGYKTGACSGVEFTNADPAMITLMMRWFREVCNVCESKFRIRLQLHNKEDIAKAQGHWAEITSVPLSQFTKPYLKISPTSKGKFGRLVPWGICSIRVSDRNLLNKILGWIKGFSSMAPSSSPV